MDNAVKSKWLSALRSGEYEQEQGTLKAEGHCCLGVLCDVVDSGGWQEFGHHSYEYHYDGDSDVDVLPEALVGDVGLEEQEPEVRVEDEHGREHWVELTVLNDGMGDWEARSFEEIADLIEEQL